MARKPTIRIRYELLPDRTLVIVFDPEDAAKIPDEQWRRIREDVERTLGCPVVEISEESEPAS